MLRALVDSASRFSDLPPHGYDEGQIRWLFEIDPRNFDASLVKFEKGQLKRYLPVRGDRSGRVSEDNLKPALLVDKAAYALGLGSDGALSQNCLEHHAFRSLIEELDAEWPGSEPFRILAFLRRLHANSDDAIRELRNRIGAEVKPNETVAFRADATTFPFESAVAQSFWARFLGKQYRLAREAHCSCCGMFGPVLRILPSQISFAGYSCPIASFNAPAFNSYGRDQTANSPLCFSCASQASRVLQHLLDSERHHRELVRDESKGAGKSPLRNQWAVFWLKQAIPQQESDPIDVEALFAAPLDSSPRTEGLSATAEQVGRLYGVPFSPSERALYLDQNRFYVAVLSPNKSRLVLREWIDESVLSAIEKLMVYDTARTIICADGVSAFRPGIHSILAALKPPKSTSASSDANLVRPLLRTAYKGAAPPKKLLEVAVLRFRVPERPGNRQEEKELRIRRQALAAAIKLVLTYGKQEASALKFLDNSRQSGPYLCGRLLAILEEAQMRASRWRIGTTLVDRFYSGASTSPRATLGVLLRQSTTAHMPKVRKAGAGYQELEGALEQVLATLDDEGGFPSTLTLAQQGEFALGFYHQRAHFAAGRPRKENLNQENNQ